VVVRAGFHLSAAVPSVADRSPCSIVLIGVRRIDREHVSLAKSKLKSFTIWLPLIVWCRCLVAVGHSVLERSHQIAFDVFRFSMSFAGFASPMACERTCGSVGHVTNELAKSANFRCRLERVVFFRHFLRRTDDRHSQRVKTFFARGNRIRGRSRLRRWSGRRRWFSCRAERGNCHQYNKHKTSLLVMNSFGKSCHFAGRKGHSF